MAQAIPGTAPDIPVTGLAAPATASVAQGTGLDTPATGLAVRGGDRDKQATTPHQDRARKLQAVDKQGRGAGEWGVRRTTAAAVPDMVSGGNARDTGAAPPAMVRVPVRAR